MYVVLDANGPASSHSSYGWQTDAARAGTCRHFSLQLSDGTAPNLATFMFRGRLRPLPH